MPISADIARPDQITDAYQSIQCSYGPIDALVNVSAAASTDGLWSSNPAAADTAADAALRGAMHCTQLVVPFMLKHHAGRIISIAPSPLVSGFAGRGGVMAWADELSHELEPLGIIASMLCPAQRTLSPSPGSPQRVSTLDASFNDLAQMLEFLLTRPASLVYQRLAVVQPAMWQ